MLFLNLKASELQLLQKHSIACKGASLLGLHVRRRPSSIQPNKITTHTVAAVTPTTVLGQQFTITLLAYRLIAAGL
jgi:hypothetical protein